MTERARGIVTNGCEKVDKQVTRGLSYKYDASRYWEVKKVKLARRSSFPSLIFFVFFSVLLVHFL